MTSAVNFFVKKKVCANEIRIENIHVKKSHFEFCFSASLEALNIKLHSGINEVFAISVFLFFSSLFLYADVMREINFHLNACV